MLDLTINDQTQSVILDHLAITEKILGRVATHLSGSERQAQILAMPDLGMPHNVTRMLGGFFTGALYTWDSQVPFIPVDATINIDNVSVYKIEEEIPNQKSFYAQIKSALMHAAESSYVWNFAVGNHFVTYGRIHSPESLAGNYIVLHGSSAEFKAQKNGLYPVAGNWYFDSLNSYCDPESGRFLRYIAGRKAERFFELARSLEIHNQIRHRYFAEQICGHRNIVDEIVNIAHYGMPNLGSVAIGCQWLAPGDIFMLLTAPQKPMYLIQAYEGNKNKLDIDGTEYCLCPHGLGKRSRGNLTLEHNGDALVVNGTEYYAGESLIDDQSLEIRDDIPKKPTVMPEQIKNILGVCPGGVLAVFEPIYSYSRHFGSSVRSSVSGMKRTK